MVAAALDRPGLRLTREELLERGSTPLNKIHTPTSSRPGGIPGKPPGTGMDLREIRLFVEGDDLRLIAPSVTARTGQLHVRSFHEDRDDATLLIADFRRTMLWGTATALRSVRAGRVLADLGWQAMKRGSSVGLLIVNDLSPVALPLATGEPQMIAIASTLAKQHDEALSNHPPGPGGMAESLGRVLPMAPPGIEIHLATGVEGLSPEIDPMLAKLARRRRLVVHLILDRIETAPPFRLLRAIHDGFSRHGRPQPFSITPLVRRLNGLGAEVRKVLPDDT